MNDRAELQEDPLRSAFVEMLFALAVSQVAIYAADLVTVSDSWFQRVPAVGHLVLGLMVIAASWLGWRQSVSQGMKQPVHHIFSLPFVGLMLDVLLVVFYFILVRSVELKQMNDRTILATPSASPESLWLASIFVVYALWDILADVLVSGSIPPGSRPERARKTVLTLIVSAGASIISAVLAYFVLRTAKNTTDVAGVLLLDGALLSLVLLFRMLKIWEHPVAKWLRVSDCNGFRKPRKAQGNEPTWAVALTVLYGLCVGIARIAF